MLYLKVFLCIFINLVQRNLERISGESNSRKDLQSTKLELRPQIFVKQSFREFYDLCAFDIIAVSLS